MYNRFQPFVGNEAVAFLPTLLPRYAPIHIFSEKRTRRGQDREEHYEESKGEEKVNEEGIGIENGPQEAGIPDEEGVARDLHSRAKDVHLQVGSCECMYFLKCT